MTFDKQELLNVYKGYAAVTYVDNRQLLYSGRQFKGGKSGSLGGKDVSGSDSSGEGSGLDEGSSSGEGSGLDSSESRDKKTLRHYKEPGEKKQI